jgi:hypothetical protein
MVNDVIREGAGKHGHALQGVDITSEKWCTANKDLSVFWPLSIAGTLDSIVSVVMSSLHHCTFKSRFGDLKCLQRTVLWGSQAYWVMTSKVALTRSWGSHVNKGHRIS